jgi:hypothetical protein
MPNLYDNHEPHVWSDFELLGHFCLLDSPMVTCCCHALHIWSQMVELSCLIDSLGPTVTAAGVGLSETH